jgi:hypothetical protein
LRSSRTRSSLRFDKGVGLNPTADIVGFEDSLDLIYLVALEVNQVEATARYLMLWLPALVFSFFSGLSF